MPPFFCPMPTPTQQMKTEAQRGLDWRREFGRGGTEVGIARARDIVNGADLSIDTVNRMASFFARHEVDKEAQGFRQGEDGYPSNGRIAWALWGGDAGWSWARGVLRSEGNKTMDETNEEENAADVEAANEVKAYTAVAHEIKLVGEDDQYAYAEGYGVVFGGKDLTDDTFLPDTDYRAGKAVGADVLIDHTLDTVIKVNNAHVVLKGIDEPVGEIETITPDNVGLYMRLKLAKASQYWAMVQSMLATGKCGLSTGSVGHRVRRENGVIKAWPIAEVSLTLTPAEPRTVGVSLKSDDQTNEQTADLEVLPEADSATAEQDETKADDSQIDPQQTESTKTEDTMEIDYDRIIAGVSQAVAPQIDDKIKAAFAAEDVSDGGETKTVNLNMKTKRGDSEVKALAYFARTGDIGAIKANDTIGNETTAADGGNAVPTGHYQGIIAKRSEQMLAPRLGVMNIPGKGLTVNVPADNSTLASFAVTSEQVDNYGNVFNRDMPALASRAMTLVKYGTKVALTDELLADEDSKLVEFIQNYIARDQARQHNALLVTEALASGTAAVTAAGTAAITAAEVVNLEYSLADEYADNANWLMRRAVEGYIRGLQGNDFLFQSTPSGDGRSQAVRTIDNYQVHNAAAMPALAASAKTAVFGNFTFVGMREGAMSFLRDPYTTDGIVYLKYYFRTVYKVLIPEAIQYLTQAAP